MPGDELSRIREYEKLGNKYLAAGDRALKQLQIANAPMMKYLDAVDCWDNAGKCFNIAGEFEDSSHAYSKAADCLVNIGLAHQGAVFSLKCAEMMRRVDPAEAVPSYENAIGMYCEIGRFFTAGNLAVAVAELFEEDKNIEEALGYYKQAADYYKGEGYDHQASINLLKVAKLAALTNRFDFATETFEKVSIHYINDNLKRLNVKDLFLRAGLCQLANGGPIFQGLASHKVLQYYILKWKGIDYEFATSRECLFLENMLLVIPKADLHVFADHVYNMDNVVGFDSWCLRLLKRVKEDIEERVFEVEGERKIKAARDKLVADVEAGIISKDRLEEFDDANGTWDLGKEAAAPPPAAPVEGIPE